ncbi:MAG TPA: tetratricopeptide repeat protein [Acidobacteriaceae bacterium]|jgi:predicted Zn-dependent protease|nr:tetratricopeptide repeat protein [Acidobacteriaceae bacterium]
MSNSAFRLASPTCLLTAFVLTAGAFAQTAKPSSQQPAPAPASQSDHKADAAAPGTPDQAGAYYHYMMAHEYEEMATTFGRSEYANRAIEEYKMALNDDPSSKYLNSHLADLYFKTGHIREAIVAAQDRVKQDPSDLDAHRLLAEVYLRSLGDAQQGDVSTQMLKLAIGEYQKIVQLEPNSPEDHLMLARLYAADHESAQAESELAAARKIDPGSEETALIANRFYADQGDTTRAIEVLKALPDDDQTSRTEYQLGMTYDEDKDTKDAIAAFKKALDLEPDNLDVERRLAADLMADNQMDAALTAWKDIAAGDPTDPDALAAIAEIDEQKGNLDDALASIKKARELSSDSLKLQFDEGRIDYMAGHLDDAAKIFEGLVAAAEHPSGQYSEEEKQDYKMFLDNLAEIYKEENQVDREIATYQKMAALGGDYEAYAYDMEVQAWRDAHDYDKAVSTAREGVDKLPKSNDLKLTLARQLADTGQVDQGIAMAKAVLDADPKDMQSYYQLAQIYTDLRKWKDASDTLDDAAKIAAEKDNQIKAGAKNGAQIGTAVKDDQIMITFERAMLADRARRYDEAETEFRKVLADDPNNALALNNFGFMLADRGVKLDEALSMIRKAVQLEPTNYAYLDSLGWVYFRMGQYTQAEDNIQRALSRGAGDPTVHDHLGDIYEKTGRLKLAAAQWELSLNEYAKTVQADMDPGDVGKVQKKLDSARVRLAKESATTQPVKSE